MVKNVIVQSILSKMKENEKPTPTNIGIDESEFATIVYAMAEKGLILNAKVDKNSMGFPVKASLEYAVISIDGINYKI